MGDITVVKIGGSTLGSGDTTVDDIVALQREKQTLVVIHGGGKLITDWLKKLGMASRFVGGERVTDAPSLEVVISVLAGLVNKDIVASINRRGGRAVGISGVDGSLIEGRVADPAKGYVGAVEKVNTGVLTTLIAEGFVPVVAPVGLNAEFTGNPPLAPSAAPHTLNYNADTIAGEIAAAVGSARLVFLTDVAGILDQSGSVLPRLSPAAARGLLDSGVASGGMIPKVRACLRALSAGGSTCIVDGREPQALLRAIGGAGAGTVIEGQ